jgi:Zn-dependent protease
MSGWFSLLGVAVLVAALILVQLLRSVLSIPFPLAVRLRAMTGAQPPTTFAPLFAEADTLLTERGFSALGWLVPAREPAETPGPVLLRLYLSADRMVLAQVIAPYSAAEPHNCRIHLVSQTRDGRLVFTVPWTLSPISPDPTLAVTQMAVYPSLHEQVRSHHECVASHGPAVAWPALAGTVQRLEQYEAAVIAGSLARRELLPHGEGSLRLGLRAAFRVLRSAVRPPESAPAPANATEVPTARAAAYWRHERMAARHSPRLTVQWSLFLLSALAFALLGAWFWTPTVAVLLLAVIALHETGHWWAMRAFGYRNAQMLMLPMVGGVTIGHEQNPSASARAWVSLLGPLPGVVLGCLVFAFGADIGDGWLWLAALLLLMVNLFNLLPVSPLDGGQLLRLLLPERSENVRKALDVLAILALAGLAWWLGAWWLLLLAWVPISHLRHASRDTRLIAALQHARNVERPRSEIAELTLALTVVREDEAAPEALSAQFALADSALAQARVEAMDRRTVTVLSMLWIGCFIVPLALPQVRDLIAMTLPSWTSYSGRQHAGFTEEARRLSHAELVDAVTELFGSSADGDEHDAPPISTARIAQLETEMGHSLDPLWRTILMAPRGGIVREVLDVVPPTQFRLVAQRGDCLALIDREASWAGFGKGKTVAFNTVDADTGVSDTRYLDRAQVLRWLAPGPCTPGIGSLALIEPTDSEWVRWDFALDTPHAVGMRLRTQLEQVYVGLRMAQSDNDR